MDKVLQKFITHHVEALEPWDWKTSSGLTKHWESRTQALLLAQSVGSVSSVSYLIFPLLIVCPCCRATLSITCQGMFSSLLPIVLQKAFPHFCLKQTFSCWEWEEKKAGNAHSIVMKNFSNPRKTEIHLKELLSMAQCLCYDRGHLRKVYASTPYQNTRLLQPLWLRPSHS